MCVTQNKIDPNSEKSGLSTSLLAGVEAYPTYLTLNANCGRKITPGTMFMGLTAVSSTDRRIIVTRVRDGVTEVVKDGSVYIAGETLTASLSATAGKYLIDVAGGAKIDSVSGAGVIGCSNTRSALAPATFTMPDYSDKNSKNITIVAAWTQSRLIPVSITKSFTLQSPYSSNLPQPTLAPQYSPFPTYVQTRQPTRRPTKRDSVITADDDNVQGPHVSNASLLSLSMEIRGAIGFIIGSTILIVGGMYLYNVAFERVHSSEDDDSDFEDRHEEEEDERQREEDEMAEAEGGDLVNEILKDQRERERQERQRAREKRRRAREKARMNRGKKRFPYLSLSQIYAVLTLCLSIAATILIAKWSRDPTSTDTYYLGRPGWVWERRFALHPILMVAGLFFIHVNGVTAYTALLPLFTAKTRTVEGGVGGPVSVPAPLTTPVASPTAAVIHLLWEAAGIILMSISFYAVYSDKETAAKDELHYLTMHSWVGVATIALVCASFVIGCGILALQLLHPRCAVCRAFDLNLIVAQLRWACLAAVVFSSVTGIMSNLPHGYCDPVVSSKISTIVSQDAARFYIVTLTSCKLAHGLGIVIVTAAITAFMSFMYRDVPKKKEDPFAAVQTIVVESSGRTANGDDDNTKSTVPAAEVLVIRHEKERERDEHLPWHERSSRSSHRSKLAPYSVQIYPTAGDDQSLEDIGQTVEFA